MKIRHHLFAPTGAPLKVGGKYKGIWPAPVYVAKFADGTTGRAPFYSEAGKPIDFPRARAGVCWLWRRAWPALDALPRTDLVGGHVEIRDEHGTVSVHTDPMTAKKQAVGVSAADKLIAQINKLSAAQRLKIMGEIQL